MTFVIERPGEYQTRDGKRVTVEIVVQNGSSFPVKGRLWRMYRGKYQPRSWRIWKPTGEFMAYGQHANDIVREL